VKAGDVLVATVRPNLNGVAASTGFCVLRTKADLDNSYLFHWVRSPVFVTDMVRKATGASYPAVSNRIVKSSSIPLPSLLEQRRIAEVLDRADALRTQRQAVLALTDELTRSIFIDTFGDMAGDYVTTREDLVHPRGWRWERLSEIASLATGHTPDRSRPDYWGGSIPWISLPEIRALDGEVAFATDLTITTAGLGNSSAVLLPKGTVCLSRTASIGFVTMLGKPMATSQDFVNWVVGDHLRPVYLMNALMQSRARLRGLSDGSTHKTICMRVAERFRVLAPPLRLQLHFEERVAVVRRIRRGQRAALREVERSYASLQQRAFAGEL